MKTPIPSRGGLGLLTGLAIGVLATTAIGAAQPGPAPAQGGGGGMTNTFPDAPPIALNGQQLPHVFTLDILATDLEKSVKFYEDVLGMKVFMRRGNAGFQSVFLAFPAPDGKSLAMPAVRIMRDVNFKHTQALPDMVLATASPQPFVQRSIAAGYPVERNRGTIAFLNDPSGNIIEVATYSELNALKNPNLQR